MHFETKEQERISKIYNRLTSASEYKAFLITERLSDEDLRKVMQMFIHKNSKYINENLKER